MPLPAPDREREWAAGVTTVPFRKESRAALARTSARLRLGFDAIELGRLQQYFRRAGREPTDLELAGLAQSWRDRKSVV